MKLKLTTRDLVNIAIFSVIYFIVFFAGDMVGFLGPQLMLVGWAVTIVLNAVVFMLLVARVPKFGAVTILGLLVGLAALGSTAGVWGFAGAFGFGLIADLIVTNMGRSSGLNATRAILGYALFQLWMIALLLPLITHSDAYYNEIANQMGSEYADGMKALFSPVVLTVTAIGFVIVGALGAALAVRIARKHFVRAGLTR